MTLRSLLCLVYGTGICVGRAARNSCIILIQLDESRVLRAHGINRYMFLIIILHMCNELGKDRPRTWGKGRPRRPVRPTMAY